MKIGSIGRNCLLRLPSAVVWRFRSQWASDYLEILSILQSTAVSYAPTLGRSSKTRAQFAQDSFSYDLDVNQIVKNSAQLPRE